MIAKQSGNIPISISLEDTLKSEGASAPPRVNKWRILLIACYAVLIAARISGLAKLLVLLINAITNLSIDCTISFSEAGPAHTTWGVRINLIPTLACIALR